MMIRKDYYPKSRCNDNDNDNDRELEKTCEGLSFEYSHLTKSIGLYNLKVLAKRGETYKPTSIVNIYLGRHRGR